jgi:hypothetical protein
MADKPPNNSLEPTLLAAEKPDLLRLPEFRIVRGDLPEPSGSSARGRKLKTPHFIWGVSYFQVPRAGVEPTT